MEKYRYSWEHCYKDWRDFEFTADNLEDARDIARKKTAELGNQITGGPELVKIGELIDF